MVEAVPAAAIRALAVALQIGRAVVGGDVVLAGNVEDAVRPKPSENLRGRVELLRLRELGDVAGVQNERGALRQRVDLRDRLLQGCGDVLVRLLAEADVAVAHLHEEDALALRRREQIQAAERERLWYAAREPPDRRRARPGHAAKEPAPVDAVVAGVGRDVVAAGRSRVSLLVEPVIVTVSMVVHRWSPDECRSGELPHRDRRESLFIPGPRAGNISRAGEVSARLTTQPRRRYRVNEQRAAMAATTSGPSFIANFTTTRLLARSAPKRAVGGSMPKSDIRIGTAPRASIVPSASRVVPTSIFTAFSWPAMARAPTVLTVSAFVVSALSRTASKSAVMYAGRVGSSALSARRRLFSICACPHFSALTGTLTCTLLR